MQGQNYYATILDVDNILADRLNAPAAIPRLKSTERIFGKHEDLCSVSRRDFAKDLVDMIVKNLGVEEGRNGGSN